MGSVIEPRSRGFPAGLLDRRFSAGPASSGIHSTLQRAYNSIALADGKSPLGKPVETGSTVWLTTTAGRKTAGLVTLPASRVNAAQDSKKSNIAKTHSQEATQHQSHHAPEKIF